MKIDLYQVDAFASRIFEGNPAAVCPLHRWLSDENMQRIAMENNLSETAFFVEENGHYGLRWFTPEAEVDLCGHATLASAYVLFKYLAHDRESIRFNTKSGELTVKKEGDYLVMDFPANPAKEVSPPEGIEQALGAQPLESYKSMDYLFLVESEEHVRKLQPEFLRLKELDSRGIIVTAASEAKDVDFVSRFFAPAVGINEDPVTGSAHTTLAPFWAEKLKKRELSARQISKRGGSVHCTLNGDRVELAGKTQTYLTGTITIVE
ncbi:MAG: PhzF family phenazine biosynthesis protein [Balneolaceae bacterium]|nr:PhzF family phenazine biosynthesis protein [Balneolaceae bacterium]